MRSDPVGKHLKALIYAVCILQNMHSAGRWNFTHGMILFCLLPPPPNLNLLMRVVWDPRDWGICRGGCSKRREITQTVSIPCMSGKAFHLCKYCLEFHPSSTCTAETAHSFLPLQQAEATVKTSRFDLVGLCRGLICIVLLKDELRISGVESIKISTNQLVCKEDNTSIRLSPNLGLITGLLNLCINMDCHCHFIDYKKLFPFLTFPKIKENSK